MVALDTNVLVRYFVRDDPEQARQATRLIEERASGDQPAYVSDVVIVELCWVLERSYQWSASSIAQVVFALMTNEAFLLQSEAEIHIAYIALSTDQGSFADALIAAVARKANCSTTFTFDRKAARLPGFTLIQ